MKILVINAGSSSLKYQLIDMQNENVLAKGIVDRIAIENSFITIETEKSKYKLEFDCPNHTVAIQQVLNLLTDKQHGCIDTMQEVGAVGHRVVHGGNDFNTSVKIDKNVIKLIEANAELAPLHNPPNVAGIEACNKAIPHAPAVAVFDTSFHSTMPEQAYLYGLPYDVYTDYKIRKYGFHGTSHQFVSSEARRIWGDENLKLIVCHLGNGASLSAVLNDKCIDTSMGFTPLAGLVMGTRSGDIDSAILEYLSKKTGMSLTQCIEYLNKKSGVLGISGVSSDFRNLGEAANNGNKRAKIALDVFSYRVKHYIGAYTAILNGLDMIAFTAGIGENAVFVREMICKNLEYLGLELDTFKNSNCPRGQIAEINKSSSKVKIFVIPTNEELVIARETLKHCK
ncbi:MAG: acetate kinase [Firmicutes bacterium]|nr:acetate kinase [Bacillota bacterium]MCL1954149.1 acetate kinase [Bacillota bacterium]